MSTLATLLSDEQIRGITESAPDVAEMVLEAKREAEIKRKAEVRARQAQRKMARKRKEQRAIVRELRRLGAQGA